MLREKQKFLKTRRLLIWIDYYLESDLIAALEEIGIIAKVGYCGYDGWAFLWFQSEHDLNFAVLSEIITPLNNPSATYLKTVFDNVEVYSYTKLDN